MSAEPNPTPTHLVPSTEPSYPPEFPPPAQLPSDPFLAPDASSLKPLLNPLQHPGPPPSSTIVEPPRSPRPDLSSQAPTEGASTPLDGLAPLEVSTLEPSPVDGVPTPNLLPRDAPLPPTPHPNDETPPELTPGLIPPVVSTPTVFTIEETPSLVAPAADQEPAPMTPPPAALNVIPEAFPTPSGTTFDPIRSAIDDQPSPEKPAEIYSSFDPPAPVANIETPPAPLPHVDPTPPAEPIADMTDINPPSAVDEPMEIDGTGDQHPIADLASGSSMSSLKRAGDELDGREEKRVREEAVEQALPISEPSSQPAGEATSQPALPLIPSIHREYVPPPPRASGPTTPITLTQHKHLLAAVRALKKNPNGVSFLEPVDPIKYGIPTYFQVIAKPMDLATVETKLIVSDPRGPPKDKSKMSKWDTSKGTYGSVSEVVDDVRQIWENTRMFNGPTHLVSLAADKLEESFEKALRNLPAEPLPSALPSPATPVAGPSVPLTSRGSMSQPPVIRRTSEGLESRPKREIHAPSKELTYAEGARKPKRRNDPQLQWVVKTLKTLESTNKHYNAVSPFLFPVDQIIADLPEYAKVIKKPIDLHIIKAKLDDGVYEDVSEVNADMKLMIRNATTYNPPNHAVHTAAQQLQQLWEEKWRGLPPKVDPAAAAPRDTPSDLLDEDDGDDDDAALQQKQARLAELRKEMTVLEKEIADIQAKPRKKVKSKKPKARKQSVSKVSPGVNGHAKKPRKSKEASFKEEEEEEEETALTMTQKQELADKMGAADEDTLGKAIAIIQATTTIGDSGEIELDIDSLPPLTQVKLYNLVCRGGRKLTRKVQKSKPSLGSGRKATGGTARKSMNEQEEAERIRRMEEQLKGFDSVPQQGWDSESSEEESSEEE
ncbi:hypothetical protein M231_05068 [Tremella mesenterica]|uniref:Bromodomain-containing factor 1 n=1 Tax=Tremella mesenterica TaxID=5217 RepID=A0A4Q1BJ20_TREME|nr:hypothetical protein M231_05068 [Tremella mesenterica]